MKVHIGDIRLANNAGMQFPVCKAGAKMLDLDASRWNIQTSTDYRNAEDKTHFCKKCIAAWARRYPWATL